MKMQTVFLDSVYPSEDNPRQDFGDIEALAATLAATGGEPLNPIVLAADGERYRIVDGERRYRAMLENGTEKCRAIVCEDLDEADEAMAMLATDSKKDLDEAERARGTQQALLLGVEPGAVDRVTGRDDSRAVLKGIQKVGDVGRAQTMSLDHLAAIAALEAARRYDDADALASCDEDGWQRKASELDADREAGERMREIEAACDAAGVTLVANGEPPEGWQWKASLRDGPGGKLRELVAELGAEHLAVTMGRSRWVSGGVEAAVYTDLADEEDPEEAAAREQRERWRDQIEAFVADVAGRWLKAKAGRERGLTRSLDALVVENAEDYWGTREIELLDELAPDGMDDVTAALRGPVDGICGAIAFSGLAARALRAADSVIKIQRGSLDEWSIDAARVLRGYADAASKDFRDTALPEDLGSALDAALQAYDGKEDAR